MFPESPADYYDMVAFTFFIDQEKVYRHYSPSDLNSFSWTQERGGHHHCNQIINGIGYDPTCDKSTGGSEGREAGKWYTTTIIRTPDNWTYVYVNDILDWRFYAPAVNVLSKTISLSIRGYTHADNIEIYNQKYLFPKKEINFTKYVTSNYVVRTIYPVEAYGIVIKGKNVTLSDIANEINNQSLFKYNATTRTAISYTNLFLYYGSELIIENETLKFHSNYDGELEFAVGYGATLRIENSTITSDNSHYFRWNFPSACTQLGYPLGRENTQFLGMLNVVSSVFVIINNSIINNSAYLFFQSPIGISITNTKLLNLKSTYKEHNITNVDWGAQEAANDACSITNKSFEIYTESMNILNFNIQNLTIKNDIIPLNITFKTNSYRDKLNIYDLNAENENILVDNPYSGTGAPGGQSHTCYADGYPYQPSHIDAGIGCVNCKFKDIVILPGINRDTFNRPVKKQFALKYYLDVKVVDKNGNPIPNANVTVINEIDNLNYPPENMDVYQFWLRKKYYNNCWYDYYRMKMGLPINSLSTGFDGHTPLPLNNIINITATPNEIITKKSDTFVITDYVKKIESVPTGIRILAGPFNGLYLDVFDKTYGNVLSVAKKVSLSSGQNLHFKIDYDPKKKVISLLIKDKVSNSTIWDTGNLSLPILSHQNFNRIEFNSYKGSKDIEWVPDGYIKIYNSRYQGKATWYIDNMTINVQGKGLIENNDYSSNPELISVVDDEVEYYTISQSTNNSAFTWEFDVALHNISMQGPVLGLWLKDNNYTESDEIKIINFTYTIVANKTTNQGKVILKNTTNTIYPNGTIYYSENQNFYGEVTGVDPDESWYRPNPLVPTYTVKITLNRSINEANMSVDTNNITYLTISQYSSTLVNFTANTTNGNNVNFTICSLTAGANYIVKKNGADWKILTANDLGCLSFNNSEWSEITFTVEQISYCGNGIKEENEECDGSDFRGKTCFDYGYNSGYLSCSPECKIITTNCYNTEIGGVGAITPTTNQITKKLNLTIYKIQIHLKQPKANPSIKIAEVKPTQIPIPELTYKIFEINKTNFENEDIANITIEFKVSKSWIITNNITQIHLYRYENGWNKLETELINSTTNYNYYKSYTNLLSYFAIIGLKKEQICVENEKRCFGNELQICKNNSWQLIEICDYGCNLTTLQCNPKPIICEENQRRCYGNELQICKDNKWQLIETCIYGCNSTLLACNPKPIKPEERNYFIVAIIISIGILGGLIYLRREQITKILTKLKQIKPGSENLTERVNKIKEEIIKLKIQGKDTTEIEKELELIKKDLDVGLVSIAKYRLEKVERILKE
jgi:PGF-pre-PGF domain-containing protein